MSSPQSPKMMHGMAPLSPSGSTGSIELGDWMLCAHGKEQCETCQVDHREDNSLTAGMDFLPLRESIAIEYMHNKDGEIACKKHKNVDCGQCFGSGFKKQLANANKNAAKVAKKQKPSTSNFV